METSCGEDILEALFCNEYEGRSPPDRGQLAHLLGKELEEIKGSLVELSGSGAVTLHSDGTIALSMSGRTDARRVVQRHRVLQRFFYEMLGMAPDKASREACILEHNISDEAITRLGNYIQGAEPRGKERSRAYHNPPLPGTPCRTPLLTCEVGVTVRVAGIFDMGNIHRLLDLGIVPGEEVVIRRKLGNGAMVVEVKGCEVAISPGVADSICVEKT
jgi:DtxR family Mn-dependent transcriptional regulator